MSHERTKPPYPTYGPAERPGVSWEQYFAEYQARRRPVDPVDDDDTDGDGVPGAITITQPATEVRDGGWPKGITTWRNRLLAAGWEVKVGYCAADVAETYTKAGTVKKKAHEESQWWINSVKDGRYLTISYVFDNGKPVGGRTSRRMRGQDKNLSDAWLQEIIMSEDE